MENITSHEDSSGVYHYNDTGMNVDNSTVTLTLFGISAIMEDAHTTTLELLTNATTVFN